VVMVGSTLHRRAMGPAGDHELHAITAELPARVMAPPTQPMMAAGMNGPNRRRGWKRRGGADDAGREAQQTAARRWCRHRVARRREGDRYLGGQGEGLLPVVRVLQGGLVSTQRDGL